MKTINKEVCKLALSLLVSVLLVPAVKGQEAKLMVVGHAESVPAEMDMKSLTSVLRGEKLRWEDGAVVKIALMKTNTTTNVAIINKYLFLSTTENPSNH